MGRPDKHVDPEQGPVENFACQLRELRRSAGNPTYVTMSRRTGRSREALSAAARGYTLAHWDTVRAYVVACGGDLRDWERRYHQARHDSRAEPTELPEPAESGAEVELSDAADVEPEEAKEQKEEQTEEEQEKEKEEEQPAQRPRHSRVLVAAVIVLAVALALETTFLVTRGQATAPGGLATRLVRGAQSNPAASIAFTDADCDHWWPMPGERLTGWSYRACMSRDPVSGWRAGAQVRNVGLTEASVEVYVSWYSVPAAGGSNQEEGHQSIHANNVPAAGVQQVVGPRIEHPGPERCLWGEIAPLVTPQQRWSDSPKRDAHGYECRMTD